ncbi:sugar kinase [Wenjunlia tyrosinilytica]|uniref:Sugar kinase n=1 Tax=Wenjunlia tyrosinilytica TaxID=1544741 RepID=A0A918DUT4_9ACTN|nr:sugar kinase [Wenjunlia tyrosinilytica]
MPTSAPVLLVVGDVVTDVVAHQEHALTRGTDTAAAIEVRPGGSGANTAAWAAHSGAAVRMLGRVGADSARWHEDELALSGVEPRLAVDPCRPTARVIALVDPTGERTMVTDRAAGGRLSPEDWDDALLDGVGLVHVSGYTFFTDSGRRLAQTVLAAASRADVPVSVDPASSGFLRGFGVRTFLEATRACSVLLPNEDEAALLTTEKDPHAAAVRLSGWYAAAVVKLGARGAMAAADGGLVARRNAEPPARVVDTIGAGDAFAGGFLAARLGGADLAEALDAGCRTGALAVTLCGGRPPGPASDRSGGRTHAGRAGPDEPRRGCTSARDG